MNKTRKIFILVYKSERIPTLELFVRRFPTKIPIVLIASTDDPLANTYKKRFSEYVSDVVIFDKDDVVVDRMDIAKRKNVVVYARNFIQRHCEANGIDEYIVLDDDYNNFKIRYFGKNGVLKGADFNFDKVADAFFNFLEIAKNCHALCFAQSTDMFELIQSGYHVKRKAMNVWFCRKDRPFSFMGTINEDANAYTLHGNRGKLFLTLLDTWFNQKETQSGGGLTDAYLALNTYVKSFYTVMLHPSAVKVKMMGIHHKRLHHFIPQKFTFPKIISSRLKK